MALLAHRRELAQVFGAPFGHRIGEVTGSIVRQCRALHFDVTQGLWSRIMAREQDVDSTLFAVPFFSLEASVARELGHNATLYGFDSQAIGAAGMHTNPGVAVVDLLECPLEFSLRIVGRAHAGTKSWGIAACHSARIGAVGDDDLAAIEPYVGEETFVATYQLALDQCVGIDQ